MASFGAAMLFSAPLAGPRGVCWAPRPLRQSTPFSRKSVLVRGEPSKDENDLWQYPDRQSWYEAQFCAEDMPDWTVGRLVESRPLNKDVKEVTIESEISRMLIPLRNAYKFVGQSAQLRVNSGEAEQCTPSTAPFPEELNDFVLWKVRGDLFAGQTKIEEEPPSVQAQFKVVITQKGAPDLWEAGEDATVEVGPWAGPGMKLRTPVQAFYMFPTLVLFVSGFGIATAKSLIECTSDIMSLALPSRKTVHLYYKAANDSEFLYRECFAEWEEKYGVKVITTTGTFLDAFDDDDTLVYEPEGTGAVILTAGDEDAEKAALKACAEAEITEIVKDSEENEGTQYLDSVTMVDVPELISINNKQMEAAAAEEAAAEAAVEALLQDS